MDGILKGCPSTRVCSSVVGWISGRREAGGGFAGVFIPEQVFTCAYSERNVWTPPFPLESMQRIITRGTEQRVLYPRLY